MKTKLSTSLLLLSALVCGGTTSHQHPVIGKWKTEDSDDLIPATIELFEDGSVFVAVAEGNWTVLAEGRLQFQLVTSKDEQTMEAEFSTESDTLIFTDSDGEVAEYVRVK